MTGNEKIIWTIGHSNHSEEHFLSLLQSAKIEAIADVRRFPGSRRQPQFGGAALEATLAQQGIRYRHFANLGGRRSTAKLNPRNGGWQSASFNAYADYMLTDEFEHALNELLDYATEQRTAMMCSEAVPWRCHRRLLGDALLVRGWSVLDIFTPNRVTPHTLTDFAEVRGIEITYLPESN